MPYLSTLLGRPVLDAEGKRIGKLQDVCVETQGGFPPVSSILVKRQGKDVYYDASLVQQLSRKGILLRQRGIAPKQPEPGEIRLRQRVLDRQIIDAEGLKVVRVNDVYLVGAAGRYYLSAADGTFSGLLRRLGLRFIVDRKTRAKPPHLISWRDIELLPEHEAAEPAGTSVVLRKPYSRLATLHPADIAEVVSQLGAKSAAETLVELDPEVAADTLREMEDEQQALIIEQLEPERAADILEAMDPDDAADVLGDLDDEKAAKLLRLMEREAASEARELMQYEDRSAGGLMTTDFIAVPPERTADEVIADLRAAAPETENIYYVYVVDSDQRLRGVVPLRDLVVSPPERPVSNFMLTRIVTTKPDASEDDVAEALMKYDLLALPVVDDEERLLGIITVDDVMDAIVPSALQRRLRRMLD